MLSSQFHSQCKDCFSETYHQFAGSKFRDGVLGEIGRASCRERV